MGTNTSSRDVGEARAVHAVGLVEEAVEKLEEAGRAMCPVRGLGSEHVDLSALVKSVAEYLGHLRHRIEILKQEGQRNHLSYVLTLDRPVSATSDESFLPTGEI